MFVGVPSAFLLSEAEQTVTTPCVAQIVLSFGRGGLENMAVGLARALAERGWRSVLIALDEGGDLEPAIRAAGIEHYIVGGRRLRDPRYYWRVAGLLRRIGPDVVHSHNFSALLHTAVARRLARVPRMVHTEHAFEYLATEARYHPWIRLAGRTCDEFVVVGEQVLPFYRDRVGLPSSRLRVIRNGVDVTTFRPRDDVAEIRRELAIPTGAFVVGSAGRLAPEKDLATLVRAVAHARRSQTQIQLVLVGDGSERKALEELVGASQLTDNVRFLGWRTDVPRIVGAFDLFVLSSLNEGLPLALLESMALGVPVASTPVGEIPLVIRDGTTGRLFDVGDTEALAKVILDLATNPAQREAMGARAREMITSEYNHDLMVDAYVEAYRVGDSGPADGRARLPVRYGAVPGGTV